MNIGLLGFGTIGTGVYELINVPGKSRFPENMKDPVVMTKILDKDPNKKVDPSDPHAVIVTDPDAIINDPDIGLVVALCGGMDFEYNMIKRALSAGKHVVTANKAVISEYFEELTSLAKENHVILRYEASVGGGIPIICSLKEQLKLNHINEIKGIFNGTTNFILTKMTEEGADFDETLKLAQQIGFAEADPSADIEGNDVSRKLSILSSLAYGGIIRDEDVRKRRLSDVRAVDIDYLKELGYVVKYLGHSKLVDNKVYTTVEPVLFPEVSMMSNVNSEFNLVSIKGDVVGELQFYGKGAGKDATANAVVGDVLSILKCVELDAYPEGESFDNKKLNKCGTEIFKGQYYLRVDIHDDETLKFILNKVSEVSDRSNMVLSRTHIFIMTDEVSAKDFDELAEALAEKELDMFYARIYE